MTKLEILDLRINSYDFSETLTIRGYLRKLLVTLWREGDSFSSKRPFGNSGWEYDLYVPLIKAGLISGSLDEDDYINECDDKKADAIIFELIDTVFIA